MKIETVGAIAALPALSGVLGGLSGMGSLFGGGTTTQTTQVKTDQQVAQSVNLMIGGGSQYVPSSPVIYPSTSTQQSYYPMQNTTNPIYWADYSAEPPNSLSTPVKAGIGIAGLVVVGMLAWFFLRKK